MSAAIPHSPTEKIFGITDQMAANMSIQTFQSSTINASKIAMTGLCYRNGTLYASGVQAPHRALRNILSGCRESNPDLTLPKRVYYHYTTPRFYCGPERTRTACLLIANEALFQVSYRPISCVLANYWRSILYF